eukprot:TRINITY_DN9043_c0_g1_i1.p1 TRINITY_DN9043_c0_g1~~TRINITY_DN9043_c0_g1_i1.p1  ORF type:complete len:536 (-),score=99.77 TRINITY_DN9043_c0_g1_i1:463-2034(-)
MSRLGIFLVLLACCMCCAATSCAATSSSKLTPAVPSGLLLVQTRGRVSKAPPADGHNALLGGIQNETLKQQIVELISSLEEKARACTSSTTTTSAAPMLCAAFGDPHFITFDGAQTTFVGDSILWLVRSKRVWIQALSVGSEGRLLGLAVGGPFLRGHKLLAYSTSSSTEMQVFFDDQQILQQEHSDYRDAQFLEAYRRKAFNRSVFDDRILDLRTRMKFEIGSFPDRFQSLPKGGIYLLKFPMNVAVTLTGVDFMSAVISMAAQAGGQGGYCGNFNGNADDDAEPVVPSWDKPIGEDLERVVAGKVLFPKDVTVSLLGAKAKAAHRSQSSLLQAHRDRVTSCPHELLRQAEKACENLGVTFHKFCMFDVCLTGDIASAGDVRSAEMMEEITNARGVPMFLGHGQCEDSKGRLFRSFQTKLRSDAACQSLLRALALTPGVVGAQRRQGGQCDVLVVNGTDPRNTAIPGGWGVAPVPTQQDSAALDVIIQPMSPSTPRVTTAPSEEGIVEQASSDAAWSCWMLD